jgi:predicted flap endonuclease-1-like 5' DNA nuclease
MMALWVHTVLLMGAAYCLGAMSACLIRRALSRPAAPQAVSRHVDPLPEVALQRAERFARTAAPKAASGPTPAAPAPAAAGEGAAQDLKRIRFIDAALEAELNKLGVMRYEQIAAWMRPEVQAMQRAMGSKGRISQENWIEQAQVLARGGETTYAARRARGEAASAAPTPDAGERRPIAPAPATAAQPAAPVTMQPRPATGGAAGVVADVAVAAAAGPQMPSRQALPPLLGTREANELNVAGPAAVASPQSPLAATPPAAALLQADTTATTGPDSPPGVLAPSAQVAVPVRRGLPAAHDNLRRIGGIDAATEQRLAAQGITRYSQIASWSPAEVERLERQLAINGRIARENWVEQAQILSRGGDTAFAREFDRRAPADPSSVPPRPVKLADAIQEHAAKADEDSARAAQAELGSLRSVRSEAYQTPEPGPEAAQKVAAQNKVARSNRANDLKRIRGIGVMIENRLRSLGVVSYEQIANWTAEDIDRVSQTLDFKGRIERENWVEQARILASGGATEFSRRVDRGELESSRAKR